MKIDELHLHNFRFFADQSFRFPTQFTVLIGENGRGKSAVLNGLRVAASAWLLGFKETERLHIEPEDIRRVELEIRFAPQFPAVVRAVGIVEGQVLEWARQRTDFKGGLGRTGWAEAKSLIELSRRCDRITNDDLGEVDLPVLLFFSTARLWIGAKKAVALKTKGSKIQDGYAQALTPEHKRKGTPGHTLALAWIKTAYFKELEERAASLMNPFPPSVGSSVGPYRGTSATAPLLAAVLEAISTCVPGWTELRWDLEADDLTGLYHRPDASALAAERVPLYYLSDGLRTMAGMVAEIAYRCVMLNGHHGAEAIRDSRGVVLIDELDMHLHPNWQRHVVADLKKAFPNLQFVVTTHSLFIVQSLDSQELISLDHPTDVQPKDLRLEDVATEIMSVESPMSTENNRAETLAAHYLQLLLPGVSQKTEEANRASKEQLDALENAVTDPGLRAILRMERLLSHPNQ